MPYIRSTVLFKHTYLIAFQSCGKNGKRHIFFPGINLLKTIFSMGEKVVFKTEDQF